MDKNERSGSEGKEPSDGKKAERKKRPAYTIVVISVLVLLAASIAAYYLLPHSTGLIFFNGKNSSSGIPDGLTTFQYNGFYFVKTDIGSWSTALPNITDTDGNPYLVAFHSTPFEVKDLPVYGNLSAFLPSNKTYVTMDMSTVEGNEGLIAGVYELSIKLASSAYFIQGKTLFNPEIACDSDNDHACKLTEIVNCEKDKDKKVIYFMESDKASITATENCIVLSANGDDYIKVVDRLLYSWFGIMD